MSQGESNSFRRESESISFLSSLPRSDLAVSFSGGKDSLVALDLEYRVGIRKAVFCDTTIEFPETVEYIREIEDFYGFGIDIARSPVAFFDIVDRIAIPSRRSRWCCDVFKFGPLSAYAKKEGIKGFITGLRSQESLRRKDYGKEDRIFLTSSSQINPILSWSVDDVWEYIERYGLPANPLYEHFDRVGCWCCPYRTESDWRTIERIHPELVEKFANVLEESSSDPRIQNENRYINELGWTSWISSQRKTPLGSIEPCQSGNGDELTLLLTFYTPYEVERVAQVLPIVSRDWRKIGNRIRLTIPRNMRDKGRILIEKALNCVSCGVCPTLCPTDALYCTDEGLAVEANLCNNCLRCLSATVDTLRGACIARNYATHRRTLAEV